MSHEKRYALGIEFSTQSVKMVVLDGEGGPPCHVSSFSYDESLPRYGTVGGVLPSEDPLVRVTSPLMICEALDMACAKLRAEWDAMDAIGVIKVDAMQHATVYGNSILEDTLTSLTESSDIMTQVAPALTRQVAPIWEDRSTSEQVRCLEKAFLQQGGIETITGNRAELRFPAAQVMKWGKEKPRQYRETKHIMLLSAFVTSLLAGKITPVDTGDGWGTNLNSLDPGLPGWSPDACGAVDEYLESDEPLVSKLGSMCRFDEVAGEISPYFVKKYNFAPGTVVLAGTGDNPATLMGCGGSQVISLGSSFTVNGVMDKIVPPQSLEYNVFGYAGGQAMALSVFTNGAKVHDDFMHRYICAPRDRWQHYIKAAGGHLLDDSEKLMLPWFVDESVPRAGGGPLREGFGEHEASENIRSLHLSQVLSLRLHSCHLKGAGSVCLAGGASVNPLLRQWIADAFDAEVYSLKGSLHAAPLGCAVSGVRYLKQCGSSEASRLFMEIEPESRCEPVKENRERMKILLERYRELEKKRLEEING